MNVVVTGGTSGLGREVVSGLRDRDNKVIVASRRTGIDLRTGEELRLEGPGPLVADGRIEIRHRSLYPEKGQLTDVMISRADGERPAVGYYLRYLRDRPDSIVGALQAARDEARAGRRLRRAARRAARDASLGHAGDRGAANGGGGSTGGRRDA